MAKLCKVCLGQLRTDGRCLYRCDPTLSAAARRRACKERRVTSAREARRAAWIGLSREKVGRALADLLDRPVRAGAAE
jgi:hypothetical protein